MIAPHLSSWTEAGSLVFVSGQLPLDADRRVSAAGIGAQTKLVIATIEAVLERAGLTLADIVKTTVWLRDAADFPAFNDSYAACFADNRPARSTVVSDLVLPGALVEIEAVARRPQ